MVAALLIKLVPPWPCRWNKGALEEGTAGDNSGKLLSLLEPQYKVGG